MNTVDKEEIQCKCGNGVSDTHRKEFYIWVYVHQKHSLDFIHLNIHVLFNSSGTIDSSSLVATLHCYALLIESTVISMSGH